MTPSLEDFTPVENVEQEKSVEEPISTWQMIKEHILANKPCIFSILTLFSLLLFSIITPLLSKYSYYEVNLYQTNLAPSFTHLFGTDDLGRDMLVRTAYGARISLTVGIAAACIDVIIGIVWGGIAGLFGGKTDQVLMRIADILFSLPYLLVVVLFTVVLGSGLFSIILALSLIGWISMARIVRGQVQTIKQQEFVFAAHALGASKFRILFTHILPNALGPIIVTLTFTIPSAIFAEAFLSFIGLGVQAPMASWGTMANDGLPALRFYPWRLAIPSFFISCTMLAFNIIGDALRDAFDPHMSAKAGGV